VLDNFRKSTILKSAMRKEEQYYKTPRALRKSGGTKGGVSAAKVAENWDEADVLPSASYDKGWWAETKRMVDEGYIKFWAKRGINVDKRGW
jgi:hypothetical protein